eukprot:9251710-Pyramimonas_sp.AAC.2
MVVCPVLGSVFWCNARRMVAIPVLGTVSWRDTLKDCGRSCSSICILVQHSSGRLSFILSDL